MRILSKPLHFLQVSISFEHSPPSYLPHDEARIRNEVEELRQYKETDLRAERQFLEHRKEHIQFEPLCQHCRDEDGVERNPFSEEDEWMVNQLDVMAEVRSSFLILSKS